MTKRNDKKRRAKENNKEKTKKVRKNKARHFEAVTTPTPNVSDGNIRGNCAACAIPSNTVQVTIPNGASRATEEESVDGSEDYPSSVVTKSPGVTDGMADGVADSGDSVSTMHDDAVDEEKKRQMMMKEYLEEQAALGNREAKENIVKKVASFARNDVFSKLKFFVRKVQLTSKGNVAQYVMEKFVKKRNADSEEVTVFCREQWWDEFSTVVAEALTRKRAEVMCALKKGLVGT